MVRAKNYYSNPDYWLIAIVLLLTFFGLLVLSSASSDLGQKKFGDSYYYLKHQAGFGLAVGLVGFFLAGKIAFYRWEKLAPIILLASVALLFLVFTPLGFSADKADRWIKVGPLTVQPAEIVKLTFLMYIAAWLAAKPERSRNLFGGFAPFLIICGIIAALLLLQPSTSSVFIIGSAGLLVYFLSGAKISYIGGAILLGALILGLVIYLTPYRFNRMAAFFNPHADTGGGGYHLAQSLNAIGSGGLLGVGFGKSTTKFNYLPEPIGDSIFAVIAEETGFIGAAGVILAYLVLIYRGFLIAFRTADAFGRLFAAGFTALIGIQTFINIGAISGVIPLTGVPLPFISYGGTALAVFLVGAGVMVNISRYSR